MLAQEPFSLDELDPISAAVIGFTDWWFHEKTLTRSFWGSILVVTSILFALNWSLLSLVVGMVLSIGAWSIIYMSMSILLLMASLCAIAIETIQQHCALNRRSR